MAEPLRFGLFLSIWLGLACLFNSCQPQETVKPGPESKPVANQQTSSQEGALKSSPEAFIGLAKTHAIAKAKDLGPVSYTHLTLPTNREV